METESLKISGVLDQCGVNKTFTTWCRDCAAAIDAFDDLKCRLFGLDVEYHTTGSFGDGSFREWLQSDIDILQIYNHGSVLEEDSQGYDGQYHVMFTDTSTPPGYVKLEVRNDPVTSPDVSAGGQSSADASKGGHDFIIHKTDSFAVKEFSSSRVFRTNQRTQGSDFIYKVTSHGPAETNISPTLSNVEENVFAYRCAHAPDAAKAWLQRCRSAHWPTSSALEILEHKSVLVVPWGHPHSNQNDREEQWKLSFSLYEKYLMSILNDTQLKCYFLMKLIKAEVIQPGTEKFTKQDYNKGLKTYHFKVALFYTLQDTENAFWQEENLIQCFLLCLQRLVSWLGDNFIPDFYIPHSNLLDGRIEDTDHRRRVIELINAVITDPLTTLCGVKLNNLGSMFQQSTDLHGADIENDLARHILFYITKTASAVFDMCGYALHFISERSADVGAAVRNHFQVMGTITDFRSRQSRDVARALEQALAYLRISLASHLVILARGSLGVHRLWYMLAATMHFKMGLEKDIPSSRLNLVCVLLASGHLESAKHVLDDFERFCDTRTKCINFGMACPVSKREKETCVDLIRGLGVQNIIQMPFHVLIEHFLSAPVLFLPSELDITPEALKFEMFRSVATVPHSMVLHLQYWHRWASVDVSAMFPFLKYITWHGTDFHTLQAVLKGNMPMDNYETPQHLLGWAAIVENKPLLAAQYFLESWKICARRTERLSDVFKIEKKFFAEHNASKLWMLLLMFRLSNTTT